MASRPPQAGRARLASRGARLTVLAVLGLLAYWCTKAFPGKADPAELQARLSRLELECNTTCPACPACQEPACPTVEKGGCDQHGKYDLSHLNQVYGQDVGGPIMDDEALFLYSIVRGLRLSRILEIGGLSGYSARNFLQAMTPTQGVVYTVDVNPVTPVDPKRHICIQKDARHLDMTDVGGEPLDLVFFDCHIEDVQWEMYHTLEKAGIINNHTLLAFHDTNTHPKQMAPWAYETKQGWVHQWAERNMVNRFHELGWDAFMLHPRKEKHTEAFPLSHGCVIMSRFERLLTEKPATAEPATS